VPEAEFLTESKIESFNDMVVAAKAIATKWDCNCVLKGGHLNNNSDEMVDVVVYDGSVYSLSSPVIHDCDSTHGTGCTFSAALAAAFALELDWDEALLAAKSFVFGSLNESIPIGEGINAMYPPSYSYNENVVLEKYEK